MGRGRWPAEPADRSQDQRQHAQAEPGLLQAQAQQWRNDRPRPGDAQADPEKDRATGQAFARSRHMRQHRCRHQHHDRATGNARQQAPSEKPAHRQRKGTGEKRQGHRQHHQAQCSVVGGASSQRVTDQRADQIAHQIGGAEKYHVTGAEPVGLDQRGNQRRVGKTRQTDADQAGAKAGEDRHPDCAARGRGGR